jgi:hypothetical protein
MEDLQASYKHVTTSPPLGSFLSLPRELRQLIYEEHLTSCPQVEQLAYTHPDITIQSQPGQEVRRTKGKLVASKAAVTSPTPPQRPKEQTEDQPTKIVNVVVQYHPFMLLNNRQSEMNTVAQRRSISSMPSPSTSAVSTFSRPGPVRHAQKSTASN